jgi:predicted nucleic acid-binding protein
MRFVDTNVLIYTLSTVPEEAEKAEVARALVDADDLALSVQVLQEFYVQSTRPGSPGHLSHARACALLDAWLRFPVLEHTVLLVQTAVAASARWRISYWDAAIIEAARQLGCTEVLSEDLQHGQDFDGVRVVNPFR